MAVGLGNEHLFFCIFIPSLFLHLLNTIIYIWSFRLFPDGEDNDDRRDTFGQSSEMASGPVHPFHPKITIRRGILAKECAEMMQQLFQLRRKQKKIKQEEENQAATLTSSHRTKFFTRIHNMFSMIFCL